MHGISRVISIQDKGEELAILQTPEGKHHFGLDPQLLESFRKLKEYLSHAPLLFSSREEETLFMYLGVAAAIVSVVICSL